MKNAVELSEKINNWIHVALRDFKGNGINLATAVATLAYKEAASDTLESLLSSKIALKEGLRELFIKEYVESDEVKGWRKRQHILLDCLEDIMHSTDDNATAAKAKYAIWEVGGIYVGKNLNPDKSVDSDETDKSDKSNKPTKSVSDEGENTNVEIGAIKPYWSSEIILPYNVKFLRTTVHNRTIYDWYLSDDAYVSNELIAKYGDGPSLHTFFYVDSEPTSSLAQEARDVFNLYKQEEAFLIKDVPAVNEARREVVGDYIKKLSSLPRDKNLSSDQVRELRATLLQSLTEYLLELEHTEGVLKGLLARHRLVANFVVRSLEI